MCEISSERLEPRLLPSTPHKHLYLWAIELVTICPNYSNLVEN